MPKPELIGHRNMHKKPYREARAKSEVTIGLNFQLIEMRRAKGWTQAELAMRMGTKPSVVSRLESDDYLPSLSTLLNLANVYDVALLVRLVSFDALKTLDRSSEALCAKSFEAETRKEKQK